MIISIIVNYVMIKTYFFSSQDDANLRKCVRHGSLVLRSNHPQCPMDNAKGSYHMKKVFKEPLQLYSQVDMWNPLSLTCF